MKPEHVGVNPLGSVEQIAEQVRKPVIITPVIITTKDGSAVSGTFTLTCGHYDDAPPAAEQVKRPIVRETQYTVSAWADQVFGPPSSNARIAARANEEMAELLRALTDDDRHPKATEEIADVVIVLCRLITRLGGDLDAEISRKMAVNRARIWNITTDGHGYHVREKNK